MVSKHIKEWNEEDDAQSSELQPSVANKKRRKNEFQPSSVKKKRQKNELQPSSATSNNIPLQKEWTEEDDAQSSQLVLNNEQTLTGEENPKIMFEEIFKNISKLNQDFEDFKSDRKEKKLQN